MTLLLRASAADGASDIFNRGLLPHYFCVGDHSCPDRLRCIFAALSRVGITLEIAHGRAQHNVGQVARHVAMLHFMGRFSLVPLWLLFGSTLFAKPRVVTTHTILADFVRNVGGDYIDVDCILPPSVDPHTYEPKPADIRLLSKADLVIVNGFALEPWADRLIENSGFHGTVTQAAREIPHLLKIVDSAGSNGSLTGTDPHAWQNPVNAISYVEVIAGSLTRIDPEHTENFKKTAATYIEKLRMADQSAQQTLSALPPTHRKLATSHDALQYLADHYGLTIIPIAGPQPDREPSARELAALVSKIRTVGVRAVFFESTTNPKLAQVVAEEAHVLVIEELYTDSLGPTGSPADTYLGMLKWNVETIARALKE